MDADIDQKLTDIFAEMARSYDEANIWTQRKRVLLLVQQEIAKAEEAQRKSIMFSIMQGVQSVEGDIVTIHATKSLVVDLLGQMALDELTLKEHKEQ